MDKLKSIKEWRDRGGEVFIENSPEIDWLITELELMTDRVFDLGIELAELKGLPSPYDGT